MIDLKKVYEDAVMAAGDAGAAVGDIAPASSASAGDADIVPSNSSMTTTDDVLGKHCDHHKDGYLGPECFHVPAHTKHEIPSKKRKGQKNPYTKGMKVLTDAELDRDTILAIHKIPEANIIDFVQEIIDPDTYGYADPEDIEDGQTVKEIQAIIYCPSLQLFFIKFKVNGSNRSLFAKADFEDGKFKLDDDADSQHIVYNAKEAKHEFDKLLVNGKLASKTARSMKCWTVWGGI